MIGYYAHNHGSGHCNYARLLQESLKDQMVTFTAADAHFPEGAAVVHLPDEDLNGTELPLEKFGTPSYLHYAPAGMKKITLRNYTLLKELISWSVKLLIIDVSVEVAALARVCSIPYAYVRMFGERQDLAHIGAYEGAAFLIAYYPQELEPESTPVWIRNKTLYMGFFSRFSNQHLSAKQAYKKLRVDPKGRFITFLNGFGGDEPATLKINRLASEFPDHLVVVVGPHEVDSTYSNVIYTGVVQDISPYVLVSDFVVGACGSNSVSELASLRARFVALPEERPFNEQRCFARMLEKRGLISISDGSTFTNAAENLPAQGEVWQSFENPCAPAQFSSWLTQRDFDLEAMLDDIHQHHSLQKILIENVPKDYSSNEEVLANHHGVQSK